MQANSNKIERTCRHCGKTFLAWPFKVRAGKALCCSTACARASQAHYKRPCGDLVARFWALVNKDGPVPPYCPELGPCWIWQGTINNASGYGQISAGGRGRTKLYRAHRLSYELCHGPIFADVNVLHRCDVRACVHPEHLFVGTQADNMTDMIEKGRQALGELHGKSILTAELVREGRRRILAGEVTASQYAREIGVGRHAVTGFMDGETWQHLD
jgi:hypothetical protein